MKLPRTDIKRVSHFCPLCKAANARSRRHCRKCEEPLEFTTPAIRQGRVIQERTLKDAGERGPTRKALLYPD